LGELDAASVDMRCLLLIGARGTRVTAAGAVWTPRWVPEPAFPGPPPMVVTDRGA
jgi:precorrin-3B methylase